MAAREAKITHNNMTINHYPRGNKKANLLALVEENEWTQKLLNNTRDKGTQKRSGNITTTSSQEKMEPNTYSRLSFHRT